MYMAKDLNARVLSNDYNLNKVAQLSGVDVININDLANALKPVVLPGERMTVQIVKPGEEPGQGVGYLGDGTMVVVEQARAYREPGSRVHGQPGAADQRRPDDLRAAQRNRGGAHPPCGHAGLNGVHFPCDNRSHG